MPQDRERELFPDPLLVNEKKDLEEDEGEIPNRDSAKKPKKTRKSAVLKVYKFNVMQVLLRSAVSSGRLLGV
jgi:hypothetical protein